MAKINFLITPKLPPHYQNNTSLRGSNVRPASSPAAVDHDDGQLNAFLPSRPLPNRLPDFNHRTAARRQRDVVLRRPIGYGLRGGLLVLTGSVRAGDLLSFVVAMLL